MLQYAEIIGTEALVVNIYQETDMYLLCLTLLKPKTALDCEALVLLSKYLMSEHQYDTQ